MIELYVNETYLAEDANDTNTVTDSVDITTCSALIFYIFADTGVHVNHKFELEVSPDGTNWQTHASSDLTGLGHKHIENLDAHVYARLKCTTAEGANSTVDIYLQAIRNA